MSSYLPLPPELAVKATQVGSWCTALAMAAWRANHPSALLGCWALRPRGPHLCRSPTGLCVPGPRGPMPSSACPAVCTCLSDASLTVLSLPVSLSLTVSRLCSCFRMRVQLLYVYCVYLYVMVLIPCSLSLSLSLVSFLLRLPRSARYALLPVPSCILGRTGFGERCCRHQEDGMAPDAASEHSLLVFGA